MRQQCTNRTPESHSSGVPSLTRQHRTAAGHPDQELCHSWCGVCLDYLQRYTEAFSHHNLAVPKVEHGSPRGYKSIPSHLAGRWLNRGLSHKKMGASRARHNEHTRTHTTLGVCCSYHAAVPSTCRAGRLKEARTDIVTVLKVCPGVCGYCSAILVPCAAPSCHPAAALRRSSTAVAARADHQIAKKELRALLKVSQPKRPKPAS